MPELSIVIAEVHGRYGLDFIRNRCKDFDVNIILVVTDREFVEEESSQVLYIRAEPDSSERQMRLAGLQRATGKRVAILGDRYEVSENWMRVALASGINAIAGSVLPPATLSRSGWAIYLAEYSDAAHPVEGNVIYQPLSGGSANPAYSPELSVFFARPPRWRQYLAERYRDSREWARERCSGSSRLRRLRNAASRIALPPLLIWRRARGRYRRRFVAALPFLLVSGCVEAAGEIVGFLSGEK